MKRIIILILLLLIPVSSAVEDYNLRQNLSLELYMHSSVDVEFISSQGFLDYSKITLNYLIRDSNNQKILKLTTNPDSTISDRIVFEWKKPTNFPLDYEVRSLIETNSDVFKINKKVNFPIKSLQQDVYEYTKPTEMIDVNDDIKKLAATISENDDDLYSIVFKLAAWTNKNIKYDLTSAGADAVEKSSWVLKNRVGVCDELTNLFISLTRSLGIPARFVTGMAYTNDPRFKAPWGLHGWAEVYFPGYGWVPFDPTYGEFGFIDSGHIKLKDTFDSNKTSSEYGWQGRFANLIPEKLEMDVNILKKGDLVTPPLDLGIQVFDDYVGFGSYDYIEATLDNKNDYYITSSVAVSAPLEISILDERIIPVLLMPYEKKSVFWKIKVPDNLKDNYKYTFPVSITLIQQNYSVDSSFDVSKGEKIISYDVISKLIKDKEDIKDTNDEVSFFCISEKSELESEIPAIINCTITNNKMLNINDVNICLENDCKKISVPSKKEVTVFFEKEFNSSGYKFLTITAKSADISKISFITLMILDTPQVNISDLKYPETVRFDDSFNIDFIMTKSSYATPRNVEVEVYHNKNKEIWKIEDIDGIIPFNVKLYGEFLKFNENDMKVIVSYQNDKGEKYFEEKEFKITLDKTTWTQKIKVILNQVSLWIERTINK